MRFTTSLAALALALAPFSAHAADEKKKDDAATAAPVLPPNVSVTRHKGSFGGQSVAYTATTGETYLTDKEDRPVAAIFATSYVRDGGDPKTRPVTFLYNGGPGSGSLWLHMGAFGPKRVVLPDGKDDGAPPYPVIDNPESLLDVTDLVFIDPVGTGFSHTLGGKDPKEYWGVSADAKSVAEFIRKWLNENGRWASPKYIGGESYGTTRSIALINELEGSYNDVAVNGIILISTILDFGAAAEVQGNEMPYILNLPSMATTAWYHHKIANPPATVAEVAAQARAFAIGPYAAALLKGNQLGAEERASVRAELARLTGLSERFVDNANLRVSPGRFYKELLRDRGQVIGRLDTRYTGVDYDKAGEEPDNDPSFYGIDAAYTAAMNSYVRGDLKLKTDRQYVTIGGVGSWDWKLADQRGRDGEVYVNVAPYLGKALRENGGLRVFVGQGWYDFATPFFGAEYSLNRPGFDPARISFHYYDAGHMMYVRPDDLRKLSADIRAFIQAR
ncbi:MULTISPECIES: S10 family peptidase [unclassified Sphingomonas]|uniref:S10 family peptidase n=1 Tax=unclassified Sphingomonas TaxID=196159 RepID=UPI0006F86C19|nr:MULTISPECIES: peptidase S10 [unclassified Sphingomonas]KQX17678.1 peptidase S10 [Sphingomonas sp. Root1294]KQY70604.1 peptidase S10 [Sphingomonas sp. Root50]KRB91905.1 peptidase S10 [Sphingomonas sp. Root720]